MLSHCSQLQLQRSYNCDFGVLPGALFGCRNITFVVSIGECCFFPKLSDFLTIDDCLTFEVLLISSVESFSAQQSLS